MKNKEINYSLLNNVKNRFLPLPKSAVEGLEHEPKKSDFIFIKELGIGTFGIVYLVSHRKTKVKYALKIIDKTIPENIEEKANFVREVEIMYLLNHPNIVKLYGHFEDEKNCYFIMQLIPNKCVYDLITINENNKNIKLVASILKDIMKALYYLHNMKPTIIHRDVKPENILLDFDSKAYLTDFGWSNYTSKNRRRYTTCGSPLYLPPEMINGTGHNETADIWCLGVLLFELLTGNPPFQGDNIETVTYNICKLKISWPNDMDPDAKDLISKILKLNARDRLPIEKILSHKFFKKLFPNAINELTKPESHKNKIFVVSRDDPKTFYQKENKPMSAILTSSKTKNYIKKSVVLNNKRIDNKKNPIIENQKKKPILTKVNTSVNVPILNIDLAKSKNEKENRNIINKMNNNHIVINDKKYQKKKEINTSDNNIFNKNFNSPKKSEKFKCINNKIISPIKKFNKYNKYKTLNTSNNNANSSYKIISPNNSKIYYSNNYSTSISSSKLNSDNKANKIQNMKYSQTINKFNTKKDYHRLSSEYNPTNNISKSDNKNKELKYYRSEQKKYNHVTYFSISDFNYN